MCLNFINCEQSEGRDESCIIASPITYAVPGTRYKGCLINVSELMISKLLGIFISLLLILIEGFYHLKRVLEAVISLEHKNKC